MPRRRAKTIDHRARAEELRAEVRLLEVMGNLERATWLQGIAACFEEMATEPPPSFFLAPRVCLFTSWGRSP